jgi:hypothetical protein
MCLIDDLLKSMIEQVRAEIKAIGDGKSAHDILLLRRQLKGFQQLQYHHRELDGYSELHAIIDRPYINLLHN